MNGNMSDSFYQNSFLFVNKCNCYSGSVIKIFVPVIKPKSSDIIPSPLHLLENVFSSIEMISDDSKEEIIKLNHSSTNQHSFQYFPNTNTNYNNNLYISKNYEINNNNNKTKLSILNKLILKRKHSQK